MNRQVGLPSKILVVRTGAIGDVVNALCFAAALKQSSNPPHIGWVAHDLVQPLLVGNPLVDRVHLWPRGAGVVGMWHTVREVRREGYGLAVDLQRIAKSAIAARFSGAPRVLGWDRGRSKEGAWLFANERIGAGRREEHMVDIYGTFSKYLDVQPAGPHGVLPIDPGHLESWRQREGAWNGPPVVLNLGASKACNRWPWERFGEVARELYAAGFQPLLTGGPADCEVVSQAMGTAGGTAVDLVGKTSLSELTALLSRCALFIGCDTGPMHMAVAAGCPVLALFGPANPRRTGPYTVEEGPLHRVLQHIPVAGEWSDARTADITSIEVACASLEMLRK